MQAQTIQFEKKLYNVKVKIIYSRKIMIVGQRRIQEWLYEHIQSKIDHLVAIS